MLRELPAINVPFERLHAPDASANNIHHEIVCALVRDNPGVLRRGFRSELKRHCRFLWSYYDYFLPDAFRFDHGAKAVVCYEVEVTSYIAAKKLDKMAFVAGDLANQGYVLQLVRIDRLGRPTFYGDPAGFGVIAPAPAAPPTLPFERLPQHPWDPGVGPVPSRPKVEPLFPDNSPG